MLGLESSPETRLNIYNATNQTLSNSSSNGLLKLQSSASSITMGISTNYGGQTWNGKPLS